jgi:hypothetical protein
MILVGGEVTMVSDLYNEARDVDGRNHCYIEWFNPEKRIEIVFPGYEGNLNRDRFLNTHGDLIPVTGRVQVLEQKLIIHFRG